MKDYQLDAAVALRRNYDDLPFRAETDAEIARRVSDRAVTVLERPGDTFAYYQAASLPAERRAELEEKRLLSPETKTAVAAALYLRADERLSVETAGVDHLRIAAYDENGSLTQCFEAAQSMANRMEDTGRMAHNAQYGYLTAYPSDAGTGMRASVLLHLPMLTLVKQLPAAMKLASNAGMTLRSLPSGLCVLENRITLGMEEKALIEKLEALCRSVCTLERSLRWRAREKKDLNIADKGWRAFGVCQYALRMDQQEALQLWSNLVLGLAVAEMPYDEQAADALWRIAHTPGDAITRDSQLHPDVERARRVRALMTNGGS